MNRANDLFLLLLNLSQMRNRSKITDLFLEGIGVLFAFRTFRLATGEPDGVTPSFPIATRDALYGYVLSTGDDPLSPEDESFLHNATQMLAVLLQRLEFEEQLEKDRSGAKRLADKRLEELEAAVEQLQLSRNAYINLVEDLTAENAERKQAEEAMRKSEERYRLIADNTLDSIWAMDPEFHFTYLSPSTERLFGYKLSEWETLEWSAFVHPYHLDEVINVFEGLRQDPEKGSVKAEVLVRHQDGREMWVEFTASPVRGRLGELTGVVGITRDITERKRTEEALKSSQNQLKEAMDLGRMVHWEFDVATGIFTFNDRFYALYGTTAESEGGYQMPAEVYAKEFVHPDDQHMVAAEVRKAMEATDPGYESRAEHRIVRRDAEIRHIVVRFGITKDENGKTIKTHGANQDITDLKQAENKLRDSEETYRALINGLPDIVMRFDRRGRHLFVSDNFAEVFDLQPSDLIGRTHRELKFPPLMCQFWETVIGAVFGNATPFETEFSFYGKGGEIIFNLRLIPEFSALGTPQSVLAINRNITAQRKLEKDYQTLFREMLEGLALHEIICNEQGQPVDYRFLVVNPAFERMTGLKAKNIVGKTVLEVLPGTEQHWIEIYGRVALTGKPAFFEHYHRDLNKYFMVTAFRPAANQFACFFTDVTERRVAEEALRASEIEFRKLYEGMRDSLVVVDMEGKINNYNQAFQELIGYDDEEIVKLTYLDITPEQWRQAEANIVKNQILSRGYSDIYEKEYRRKDGTIVPIELRTILLQNENGQPKGMWAIIRNISERKRLEDEKAKLEAQLVQAQKMEAIGTLAGGIAHDFNNILWAIMGFTEMTLMSLPEGSKEQRNLQQVLQASERAKDLVNQILAFSRKTSHEKKPLAIALIVKETIKLLRATIPSTIAIKHNIASPKAMVLADPTQIHQIIMNLCTNSAQAMREKGDTLGIGLEEKYLDQDGLLEHPNLSPGPYVILTISDNGSGIAPEIIDKIFDPFFTTKGIGEGTGMGLAVVYGIVKAHGGEISVSSQPGTGSTFTVLLPKIISPESEVKELLDSIPQGRGHLLVVDDEKILVDLIKEMLESLGYEVTTANSSLEALKLFQAQPNKFHLVFTDQTMPYMTGMQLGREFRQIRSDIPIVLCTGFSDKVSEKTVKAAGINALLMKPINLRNLAETVRKVLDNKNE